VETLLAAALAATITGLEHQPRERPGDLDAMLERGVVRVLVPYSRTLYFNDRGAQRGLVADALRDFEVFLNRKHGRKSKPIVVLALPVTRERLLPGLAEGLGDIAAANLTVTPARQAQFAFSKPTMRDVAEIVVGGPRSPKLASLEDLGGREVHVRASSSYHGSLEALNARLRAAGRDEARIVAVDEALEDEDLMEMVAAGLLQFTVVDTWKAQIWARVYPRLRPLPALAVSTGQSVGWAFRPGSPQLAAAVDEFIDRYPSAHAARYRVHPEYLVRLGNATADADWKRFERAVPVFRKYAPRYGFDWLLLVALGYQESRLDQEARSDVGAVGIMQLMPETAAGLKVGDVTQLEPNIHGGIKYLRQLHDRHVSGQPDEQNRTLFALAAYNCGPTRLAALRAEAGQSGLDPDRWFDQVERVAARRVGQETVLYVRSIYKYYVAYRLQLQALEARRDAARPVWDLGPIPGKGAKGR
jgi:membrane-bound lytic murein transglycosylase MltF